MLQLQIRTDTYVGNFERELIAFVFGKLEESQDDYAEEYTKICFKNLSRGKVDTYDDYVTLNNDSKLLDIDELWGKLHYTAQEVDDCIDRTFYNITSNYKNIVYDCDTIFIQFKEELTKEQEDYVVNRIKEFFSGDVYNVITRASWLNTFGTVYTHETEMNLISIEYVSVVEDESKFIRKLY